MKRKILILSNNTVNIGKISFNNPIWVASGTFGYGTETPELVDIDKLGAIVTKSITLHPREGNPPPRIVETASGMINSIGLANIGVKKYVKEMLPVYENLSTKIIMNVAGTDLKEYVEIIELVESVSSSLSGYEINISCPNVKKGGMEFGVDADMTEELTTELRKITDRLLIMKLSPNVSDIVSIGLSAQNGGADAVSAINTVVGMSIDPKSGKSNIYTTYGGLSGPAIKPIALKKVYDVYQVSKKHGVPIMGQGGVSSPEDAVEFILAGASTVGVGTALFFDPLICNKINQGLEAYLNTNGLNKIDQLIGGLV